MAGKEHVSKSSFVLFCNEMFLDALTMSVIGFLKPTTLMDFEYCQQKEICYGRASMGTFFNRTG
jgi:hypothetical protein